MEQDNQRILPVFLGRNIKDNLGNPNPLVLTTILFVTAFYNTIKFFIEGDRFRPIITLRYWSVPITHPTFWMFLVDGLLVFLSSLTFIGQLQIYVRLRSEEPITFSASLIVILFVLHFIAYLIGLVFWVLFPSTDILYSLILIAFIWSAIIIIKGLMQATDYSLIISLIILIVSYLGSLIILWGFVRGTEYLIYIAS